MTAKRGEGRVRLIEAARLEFDENGYDSTNSNAIARRAGYAPQTFYRHFENKRAIFLAVYAEWVEAEVRDLAVAGTQAAIADTLIRHHRTHRTFRRALRTLTVTDAEVGRVRAEARRRQMAVLAKRLRPADQPNDAMLLSMLLMIERLCDAIVDDEFSLCGIPERDARTALIEVIGTLLRS